MDLITSIRFLGLLALWLLPGAWLAFSAVGRGFPVRVRLLLAAALSPVVVLAQFYALRLAGFEFDAVTALLVGGNLAAAPMVLRAASDLRLPEPRVVLAWAVALALPLAYLFLWVGDPQLRANWGHAWTHSDIVYLIASGQLRPEEPQLAGVPLAYPWAGHVLQAIFARVLGTAPAANYIWTNLAYLLLTVGIVAELVRRLGGGRLARLSSVLWLCFGVNVMGYLGQQVAPESLLEYPLWGDFRFTPWLRKFGVFEQTVLGIGLFAALALVLGDSWSADLRRSCALLTAVLLVSLATFYPILFVAGVAAVIARIIAGLGAPTTNPRAFGLDALGLGAGLAGAGIFGLLYLDFVTGARTSGATLGLSTSWWVQVKSVGVGIMLTPFLVGAVWTWRRSGRPNVVVAGFLVLAGAASAMLYSLLDIYYGANEYKYMFTAAVCLAPFPALATERAAGRLGGARFYLVITGVAILLSAPAFYTVRDARATVLPQVPGLELSFFDMSLGPAEEYSEVASTIRRVAPPSAVLVSRDTRMDLVALTQRPRYVAFGEDDIHGIALPADFLLLRTRGYDPAVVGQRRADVNSLYEGPDDVRDEAMRRLQEIERPLVVLTRLSVDPFLVEWLESHGGRALDSAGPIVAWVIDSPLILTENRTFSQ